LEDEVAGAPLILRPGESSVAVVAQVPKTRGEGVRRPYVTQQALLDLSQFHTAPRDLNGDAAAEG
jgi:hypothetical protein